MSSDLTHESDDADLPESLEPLRRAIGERYLQYALSTIMHRALAGCARRVEACASSHPLCDAGIAPVFQWRLPQIGKDFGRRDGELSPPRRRGDL